MVLGGFYFQQEYDLQQQTKLDGFLLGLGQPQSQHQKNWSASGFAQFYAELTETLRVQAGVRVSHEKTTATSTTANTFATVPGGLSTYNDPLIAGSLIVANGRKSWDNVGSMAIMPGALSRAVSPAVSRLPTISDRSIPSILIPLRSDLSPTCWTGACA
jgi:outer membrane receptor protein involved in Fe transport